jgi:hypothetical protein
MGILFQDNASVDKMTHPVRCSPTMIITQQVAAIQGNNGEFAFFLKHPA